MQMSWIATFSAKLAVMGIAVCGAPLQTACTCTTPIPFDCGDGDDGQMHFVMVGRALA